MGEKRKKNRLLSKEGRNRLSLWNNTYRGGQKKRESKVDE